jgi:ribulose-phosphate 3-epimerase
LHRVHLPDIVNYMTEIIPGIYENTLEAIAAKVALVAPHVDWVQLDFSDATLVATPGFMEIEKLKPLIAKYPDLSFEAHLMADKPEEFLKSLVDAGFARIIIHVEAADPRIFLDQARYESVEVGIAIDAATEFEQLEPFLEEADSVLVMTVEMGSSGQEFLPETLEKVKTIRENLPDLPIAVDGGMNADTARFAREAGATRIISTTFLFKNHAGSIAQGIKLLQ